MWKIFTKKTKEPKKKSSRKTFWNKLFLHFDTIKNDPYKFVLWVFTSILLSLSSFWIPLLLGYMIGEDFYKKLMDNNPFIIFSIIFLSNSLLVSVNQKGAGSNDFSVTLRGVTIIVTIMYLILLSSVIPLKLVSNISLGYPTQYILLALSLLLGIYVYGFRDIVWEKSVDDVKVSQDEDVDEINDKADDINIDPINNVEL